MDKTKSSSACDVILLTITAGILMFLWSVTSASAAGVGSTEATTFFTAWHGTIVGILIPLAAAGVAIGFIARAVSNARDGASPVGAVVGALVTAGGAMLLPTIAVLGAGGADFSLVPVPKGSSGIDPTFVYAFVLIRSAVNRCRYARVQ